MGIFDSFKRDKQGEPVTQDTKETSPQELSETSQTQDDDKQGNSVEQTEDTREVEDSSEEKQPESDNTSQSTEETQSAFQETVIKSYSEKKPVTHVIGQTKIMSIINQKGGVGKSTTAVNLSAALGELNKQVLLVDFDPQGNSTSGYGINKAALEYDIYDVILNDVSVEEAIIPDVAEGVDLLPATIDLAGAEVELVSQMARENRLKDAVGSLRGKYDYIFIDCPPSLGLLTVNALVASDKLFIPIQCEFYALEGVTELLNTMKLVKSRLNPSLDIFGVLLTMYDSRTTLSKQVMEDIRAYFGKTVFSTSIPRTVRLSEAPSFGQPITQYDPDGKGAVAYRDLAKEVINHG